MPEKNEDDDSVSGVPTLDSSGRRTPRAPQRHPREIGGFRILGKLGEGGMGIVYEAEQQSPRRRVALKVVRGGQFVDDVYLRMFRREAETLARLVHPNIAAIYEVGRTEDGQHFFTMELVSGQTLSAFVRDRLGAERPSPTDLRERLRLFNTICRAVNHAHQRSVIHRDLKPSNIVVTEGGEVKILDFGLARITDADVAAASVLSEMGTIKGTLPYMSPEQTSGDSRNVDLRTDVYSLGVILYELLSGRYPYETQTVSVVQAIRTICQEPPRPLKEASGGAAIDVDLQTIAAKALEKEPDQRYQSAAALAEDVERFRASQPILAHPPSTMYQLRKLVARHKLAVAAAGGVAVLLLALALTMVVQAERVRKERDRATAEAAKASAISVFLLDALGAADPWSKGSRNVTLLDALAQAQAKARTAFGSQPLVEASVLRTIGTTFSNLAEYSEAEKALRGALDLRVAAAGPKSPEAADALRALSRMYAEWRKFDEAEKYARDALEITRWIHGDKSLATAAAMNALAGAVAGGGRLPESRSLAEEVLRIARAGPGAAEIAGFGHVDAGTVEIDALKSLFLIALDQGESPRMDALSRETLALVKARYGNRHPEVATALSDYALAQMYNGDLAGAERSYLEVIELRVALLGSDHPEVASARENLGNAYFRAGKLDETARSLEVVLAMRRKALGDDSEPVARTLSNMAAVYREAGNNEAAERAYREAVDRFRRKLGPEHPSVGHALSGLGDVLRREGKFGEAEATLRSALDILVKALGEDSSMAQVTLNRSADLYTAWGKPAQAAAYTARLKPPK